MQKQQLPSRISLQKAADEIGVSTRTVRRYITDGRLRAYRIGPRLIKVDGESVRELLSGRPIGNWA